MFLSYNLNFLFKVIAHNVSIGNIKWIENSLEKKMRAYMLRVIAHNSITNNTNFNKKFVNIVKECSNRLLTSNRAIMN